MTYRAPLNELRFALRVHGRLDQVLSLPAADGLDSDTADAVLEEAARFAEEMIAPTNRTGDLHGARLSDGRVHTHPDLVQAFDEYRQAGWPGLRAPAEYGGQGLPAVVAAACEEMWCAGNLALSLLPMLTLGAAEAILNHGSDAQKQLYLPKMSAGIWSGTMNLTEPQAGSDLAQVAARAVPKDNGAYAVSGQKIFITWGDHELTENIVHLVLARLPDAPPGVKGISLFIVPKYLVNGDGSLGARNGVAAVGLEHKLGIHASPTCVMQFDEAEGYLVGEAGKGLAYMFTMMNHARLGVGIEGHAVAERAYQAALAYAQERVQSRSIGGQSTTPVAIIRHPDVRRMLLVQKATLAAQRALYMRAAAALDLAHGAADDDVRRSAQAELNFLIPIVKAWCTDNGTLLTNLAVQVFGGMGYIEETGVAQYVRDVRITAIYEGTNGIQALDLIGRKTAADEGRAARMLLDDGRGAADGLRKAGAAELADSLTQALDAAEASVAQIVRAMAAEPEAAAAASHAYLHQMACTLGAVALAREYAAAEAETFGETFVRARRQITEGYFAYVLPQVHTYAVQVLHGSGAVLAAPDVWAV
ncbi:acyl-CoA dehydrogenase family protein [Neisseria leonii]|uniref:acyl-CoA dehydrogenase family protein n=1 Tax=Neisseria leonii TaxID=2995413 RepID=UPI00237C528B|nr:acyl-CoA dehydrogenase family protein [Neisseria sp. 3986]MDD9326075.1 acyl-CoA dehydrogenase family protein [Neisseria sp. 3986]